MEFALKICAIIVYLLYVLEIVETQKPCKVPQGEAGSCVHISRCPPLMNLHKKKYKTPHDNMYFQQSFCGRPGVAIMKVCCPSQTLWNKFEAKPVLYPHSIKITESPTLNVTPTPAAIPSPITNDPVTSDPDVLPLSIMIPSFGEEFGSRNLEDNCGIDTSSANKIIGGTVVQIDQYPWLVLLQYSGDILACGGSLISHKFVLTAAHCLNSRVNGAPTHVRLSEYNISSYPTDYVETDGGGIDQITLKIVQVKTTHPHPSFDRFEKINDIGLIEMMESVKFSDFIKPICLPDRNFVPQFGPSTNFTISGWGGTDNAKESEVKLEASVPYVPWDRCEKVQSEDIMDSQICAGGVEGIDSCEGDSGGPLMYIYNERYYVVGLISYGHRFCGTEGRPATHTNVYKYNTWIKKVISDNEN